MVANVPQGCPKDLTSQLTCARTHPFRPILARIRAEERLLRTQFGDEYDTYRARTWRLIAGLY